MKKIYVNSISIILLALLIIPFQGQAGNKQRSGQAGASELLINPWARSSGWGGANTACVRGLEGIFQNVAGTAFAKGTELLFSHTKLYVGADISMNAFGFSQKIGESGVLSMAVQNIDFGDIEITTVDLPDGGIGTFNPKYTVISVSYAKEFSNAIYGGLTVKIINEGISDVTASGICFDAGIQYVTGSQEQIHFGIAMKNVGPTMRYSGDGLSFRGEVPATEVDLTVEHRSAEFELPSLITIGGAYDFNFAGNNQLILAGNFTSNSFTKDQFHLGLEFNYHDILFLRGGYKYEKGDNIFGDDFETRETAFTGPSAGISLQIPLNKENGTYFSFDYSYRDTDPFNGLHSIGARVSL
ncbi:MAG: PorV/PorQ family protein [Bacteroidota bacterium]|nr:PorV/PorQ family protein [Bacteroidota bacterium]